MTETSVIELDEQSTIAYLKERDVVPATAEATLESLGWGISNFVARVSWNEGCLVLKQSLPKLRVEDDWLFNRSRIRVEERCMRYLRTILPPTTVPRVVHSDLDNYIFGMNCAPAGGALWKEALLDGRIDLAAAERAGKLLGLLQRRSANDPRASAEFQDQDVLIEGRVDPYHRTAAAQNPDLAELIGAEVERLLATRATLSLGDFCPKNTFVYADHVLILDFEVAHWGDPAFDVAFCLNHLLLKACRFRTRARDYLHAANVFWASYRGEVGDRFSDLEDAVVRELGCLLLARVDGKSKAEYITDERLKDEVRGLARLILTSNRHTVPGTLASVADRLALHALGPTR